MSTLFQNRHFLHQSSFMLLLISQYSIFDWLNCDKMLRYLMASQVYFSKCTPTEYSTNSIEVTCTLHHETSLSEIGFNMFFEPLDITIVLLHLKLLRIHGWIWFLIFFLLSHSCTTLLCSSISSWLIIISIIVHVTQRRMLLVSNFRSNLRWSLILTSGNLYFLTSTINVSCWC